MQPPPSSAPPPPGYGYPAPPRRPGLPVWAWLLIGCVPAMIFFVAILAAILFPVFAHAREKARQVSCLSNERQMSLAALQYAQDNDEVFPAATVWVDRTLPYARSEQPYHCPEVWGQDPAKFGYAYDSRLDSKNLAAVASPRDTTLLFDSTDLSRNAADSETSLPSPGRHLAGNDIAFLDGHVRWTGSGGVGGGE